MTINLTQSVQAVMLVVCIVCLLPDSPLSAQSPDIALNVETVVASGFNAPVQVTHAGDGSGRLFVVEQITGKILIIENGQPLKPPFLEVKNLIKAGGEQGLLGLTFHPEYEKNGYFYINYTDTDGDTVIVRYTVSANDPNVADPTSRLILLTINQPATNHNGGQLLFGPDGYLYIGMGDGGGGGDPDKHGQNKNTLLGSMLRIDVNKRDGGRPYAIPADNPYAKGDGADEIWAIGLRNPWRFSFDRLTGDLYIADVGQNRWEEISYQAAGTAGGLNFGWNCREGRHRFNGGDCSLGNYTDPIAEYGHDPAGGFSVTGGFVYRGQRYPNWQGYYFYADYVSRRMWAIRKTDDGRWSTPQAVLVADFAISSFGEDEAGELYVVDHSGGTIRQLVDPHQAGPPTLTPVTTTMPITGGLFSPNSHLSIRFPDGALTRTATITYQYRQDVTLSGLKGMNRTFSLQTDQGEPTRFNSPVSVTVRYTPNHGLLPHSINLYWLSGTRWITDGVTTVSRTESSLTSLTNHFTLFSLLGKEAEQTYLPIIAK